MTEPILKSSTEPAKEHAQRKQAARLRRRRKFVMMTKAEYEASIDEQIPPDDLDSYKFKNRNNR